MFSDISKLRIYLRPGITDMRKAINGLTLLIAEELHLDPFSESLFLFCNKSRNRLKIIYWERNGFCLWLKRLERDKFPWPLKEEEVQELTAEQLRMLLEGIDFFKAHKNLTYSQLN